MLVICPCLSLFSDSSSDCLLSLSLPSPSPAVMGQVVTPTRVGQSYTYSPGQHNQQDLYDVPPSRSQGVGVSGFPRFTSVTSCLCASLSNNSVNKTSCDLYQTAEKLTLPSQYQVSLMFNGSYQPESLHILGHLLEISTYCHTSPGVLKFP